MRRRAHIPGRRKTDQTQEPQRRSLQLFQIYRLTIAIIFFSFHFIDRIDFINATSRKLFFLVTLIYLVYCAISVLASFNKRFSIALQVHVHMLIDALAFALLILVAGGISSGLGTLLIVSVAASSLLVGGRMALLFAAYGTIALLAQEVYGSYAGIIKTTAYPQAGFLGIALFTTALLAVTLAKRASESAALAERRGIDLANLAHLNEHLINRMDSGIIVVDETGEIKLINGAAKSMLDHLPQSSQLATFCQPLFQQYQQWLHVRDRSQLNSFTGSLELPDQDSLRVRFTKVGARKEDQGSVIYLQDTSELKQQVQESKLASLGRLTASIAHEIRNPLGAISHAAQLLAESEQLQPDDLRLSGIIQQQSLRLNKIIQDVLRLSRREAPDTQSIELAAWLQKFMDEFAPARGLQPGWASISGPVQAIVQFDPDHLQQILWNLCSNAQKYAPGPGDEIVTFTICSTASGQVLLDIIDHGPGIDPALQDRLFEPFFTTSDTGTGLGLYISRELCLSNGGELSYVSVPSGHGCFRIRFPQQ